MTRIIEIDKVEAVDHLTSEEMNGVHIVQLHIINPTDKVEASTKLKMYGGIPCDYTDGAGELKEKPVINTTVSYSGENVKIIKPMRKWAIIEHASGQQRYVHMNNLGKKITISEEVATTPLEEAVDAALSEETVEA